MDTHIHYLAQPLFCELWVVILNCHLTNPLTNPIVSTTHRNQFSSVVRNDELLTGFHLWVWKSHHREFRQQQVWKYSTTISENSLFAKRNYGELWSTITAMKWFKPNGGMGGGACQGQKGWWNCFCLAGRPGAGWTKRPKRTSRHWN